MKTIGLQPISKNAKVISGFAFKSSEFVDSGIPVIKITNVKKDSVTLDDCQFVDRKYLSLNEKYKINNGDVLIALTGSQLSQPNSVVGRVTRYHYKEMALLNQRVGKFIVHDTNNLNLMFLYYYLVQEKILYSLAINAKGSANQANISPSDVERIQIPAFTLSRQKIIASILSSYDDLININRRRVQLLEETARLLFREWFVYFRFPGHEKVKIIDGVPEGWEKEHLSKLVTTQYGYTETASQEEIGPKFLRGTDINKTSYIDWASVPYCPNEKLDFRKYSLSRGDILIIRMADPGKVGIVEVEIEAIFASYLVRLKVINKSISSYYLFYSLLDDKYQGFIIGSSTGSTRKSASAKLLVDYNLLIPKKEIIDSFDEQIVPIRKELNILLQQNQKLAHARDLLLPRLMSGAVEV